jgi:hypothetical protein
VSRQGRNRAGTGALFCVTAVAGKTPRAPTTAADFSHLSGVHASPARSRASAPARSEASRSSRAKPAGARESVVTPAAA